MSIEHKIGQLVLTPSSFYNYRAALLFVQDNSVPQRYPCWVRAESAFEGALALVFVYKEDLQRALGEIL